MIGVVSLRTRAAWRRRWPSLLALALLVAISLTVTLAAVAGARRTHSVPLIGIPLGIVIARFAWARTARRVGVAVVDRVPIAVVVALPVAAVLLAVGIALLPARRAANLQPAEILHTE